MTDDSIYYGASLILFCKFGCSSKVIALVCLQHRVTIYDFSRIFAIPQSTSRTKLGVIRQFTRALSTTDTPQGVFVPFPQTILLPPVAISTHVT